MHDEQHLEAALARARARLDPADVALLDTLARAAVPFVAQRRGRRPGFLRQFIARLVAELPPGERTFRNLVALLRLQAMTTRLGGKAVVLEVDDEAGVLVYRDPRRGEREVALSTVRNLARLRAHGSRYSVNAHP